MTVKTEADRCARPNPIDDPRRQTFLEGLTGAQRSQVTRAFMRQVIPGLSEPEHLTAAVRAEAMSSGYQDSHPTLSQWLVHRIDAGQVALDFGAWVIDWMALPRESKAWHLADIADTRGAMA